MTLEAKIYNGEYKSIHHWLKINFGKADTCESSSCNKKSSHYEWAKKKGCEYLRDRNNFIKLCKSCHEIYDMTDLKKKNMSLASKGKKKTPQHCLNISIGQRGKIMSIESRVKMSLAHKNKERPWRFKEVTALKDGKLLLFNSIKEASNKTKILRTSIVNCLNGRSIKAGGYIWTYGKRKPSQ